jgi:hypothetical protein
MNNIPSSNLVQAYFDDIPVLQPYLGLTAHTNARWPKLLSATASTAMLRGNEKTYVPVKMRSPGMRVTPWLRKEIVFSTPKIMSEVSPS